MAISSSGGGFVRTGLLGFVGPGGLVFVCGSREGLIQAGGRQHNTDDLIATILAVEPVKFIYRGRIVVFGVKVDTDVFLLKRYSLKGAKRVLVYHINYYLRAATEVANL